MATGDRTTRAAVLVAPGRLEVRAVALAPVTCGLALVEIAYCGVCGTDLHMVLEGWGTPGTVGGHEWSGRVLEVGAGVADLAPGDLVVGGPLPCGHCRFCAAGRPSLCREDPVLTGAPMLSGGFARQVVVPVASLHRVPAGLGERSAALAEPLAVALHAVTRAQPTHDDRVLVTGGGPLGLLVAAVLLARGHDVTVSEPGRRRRAAAEALGAVALEPAALPVVPAMPTEIADGGFDVVLECSGTAAAMAAGVGLLEPGGRLVLVGSGLTHVTYDPMRVLLNELTVTGAFNYDASGFADALAMLAGGALPLERLIHPEAYPLDRLQEGLEGLARGDIDAKLLIQPGGPA